MSMEERRDLTPGAMPSWARQDASAASAELPFLRERVRAAGLPDYVTSAADYELQRLANIPFTSPEYGLTRAYLDWLLALPWTARTPDRLEVHDVRRALDEGHFGLESAKERALRLISVMQLRADGCAPAMCFVGPPGAGKTSFAHSLARALGRKLIRISATALRTEADVLGQRRTWLDAQPGKIIRALRAAAVKNPVLLIEQIDHLSSGSATDIASTLLEALDTKLRTRFTDHYLDLPFDLSETLFIATANLVETIPEPLREALEPISFPGYVPEEKFQIARDYLLPRERERSGLKPQQFDVDEWSLKQLAMSYTSEAGVRELQDRIAELARRAASEIAAGSRTTVHLDRAGLETWLGTAVHPSDSRHPEVGAARSVVLTPNGGAVALVEITGIRGTAQITATGPAGDLSEHIQMALTIVRSRAERFDLEPEIFAKTHLHVHFPIAPAPSDIASTGLALVAALVSAYTGKPIRPDLALTGALSLRGRLLPVPGLVEKVLAARRADLQHLILPEEQEHELEMLPSHILGPLKLHPLEAVDEAIDFALLQIIVPKPEETSAIEMFQKGHRGPGNGH